MELFLELLFTVGLSLVVSFAIAKLFSMASSSDATGDKSVSVSVIGVVQEAVFCEQKRDGKSVVRDSESERRVRFVNRMINFKELEQEVRAATIGSPLTCDDDDEIDDNEEVSEEVGGVGLENKISKGSAFSEEAKGGVLKEERVTVGGVEFEEHLDDERSERDNFREIRIESDDLVRKSPKMAKFREIEIESAKDEVSVEKSEDVRVLESEYNKVNESDGVESNENYGEEDEMFDDWEGIERTELEKRFGAAVVFVGSKNNADRISSLHSDTKMQFYGLHKVAIEGPCLVPQPMALKVSARAKWNAWQQLGDITREVAMEQYINLLSKSIPRWMGDHTNAFSDSGSSTNLPSNLHKQPGTENKCMSEEVKPCDEECGRIGVERSNSMDRETEDMLALLFALMPKEVPPLAHATGNSSSVNSK